MLTHALIIAWFLVNLPITWAILPSIKSQQSVAVFGGSGGVGQLISQSLAQTGQFKVTIITRDTDATKKFPTLSNCNIVYGDALDIESIRPSLKDVDNIIISVGTTAFPTSKWKNNNTPQRASVDTVVNILRASAIESTKLKRVCLISSIGVNRADQLPFKILNSFGVLDAKRASEELIIADSIARNYEAIIIRPGRLVGPPFTNPDLATLFGISKGNKRGVLVSVQDDVSGDVDRGDIATAVTKLFLIKPQPKSQKVLSLVNIDGDTPTDEEWKKLLKTGQ